MKVPARVRQWLLGARSDPSVRARYYTEVEGRAASDPRVRKAVSQIGKTGWAAAILEHQFPDGHWITAGTSGRELYRPKYIVTNWQAIVLGDLGATKKDRRVRRTAELILDRWSGKRGDHYADLSGRVGEICVTGNAVRTLVRFGYLDHPSVQASIDWILRNQKADGGWHCFPSRTGSLDGWEGLAAFAAIPENERDERLRRSIARGAEFYLHRRLMDEGRTRYPPWFRIHYPNHYYYDLLVGLDVLTRLGFGGDRRLGPALRWLRAKQRADGCWARDADHPDLDPEHGGYSFDGLVYPMRLEPLHSPSRWVTVQALAVLARIEAAREGARH